MKKLALVAIIMLAGCAAASTTTRETDPRLAELEAKRQAIAESEKQCIDEADAPSHNEVERDRDVLECHAKAHHENAEISEQERKEYELQAQEERHRASLMAILTTSQPR